MSEVLHITCDKCGSRIGKAHRTRIKVSRELDKRAPIDVCTDCGEDLLIFLGLAPGKLPFGDDSAEAPTLGQVHAEVTGSGE